jgi:cytochrome b subunit of formate dehydrogenase
MPRKWNLQLLETSDLIYFANLTSNFAKSGDTEPHMKFSANRLVFILGAFILALMAIDGLVQLNKTALSEYGVGSSSWVTADSAMALFLVGLVAGMVVGIGIFFGYLVWREKKYAEEPDEVAALLEEIAREEAALENPLYVEETQQREEHSESMDPWERPADWWKQDED